MKAHERLRIEALGRLEQNVIRLIENGAKEEEIVKAQKAIATLKAYATPNNTPPSANGGGESRSTETDARASAPVNGRDIPGNEHRAAGLASGK